MAQQIERGTAVMGFFRDENINNENGKSFYPF